MPLKIPPFTPTPTQPTSAEPFSTFVKNTPLAQTPLTGTELVPIIQSGQSVHTPAGNVAASKGITVGSTTISGGTSGNLLYDNAGVVGEQPIALKVATGNLTFYVSTLGSDSNPGTALLPFATIQHAVSVALGFDYQGLYQCTINVANGTYNEHVAVDGGILYGFQDFTSHGALFLKGNVATPTNVVLAPTDGSNNGTMAFQNGAFGVAGFSLQPDPNASEQTALISFARSIAEMANMDFNVTNGVPALDTFLQCEKYTNLQNYPGIGATYIFTVQGTATTAANIILMHNASNMNAASTGGFIFNSAINMAGAAVFLADQSSKISFSTFTNPGNITNGPPLQLSASSEILLGFDPTTITWPGGAFTNSIISATSEIDGFIYRQPVAGVPVDQTSIYRGSWEVTKDTNQTTAGLGLNLYVDDAGTVVPLIALTPAPGNLTFFVATTGSDSNPGTSGSPFATIQHAVSFALSFDYQSLYTCTINVANGAYHEHPVVLGLVNAVNPTTIISIPFSIIGNTGTPTNCIISPNTGGSASVISFITGNFKFDGFSLVADTTSAGSDALLEIINGATVTIPTGVDFNMPLAATGLYNYGVRSNLWSRFAAVSSSMTFQGTGWNGSGGIMNGIKWSNVSIGAATLTFNSAINMGGSPVFQGLFDAAIQFNSGGSVPTFVNPGNVIGMPPISLISGSQSLIGVDPVTITWPGGTFDPTQIDGSSNIDGFFYGIQNAGQLVDETSIYRGSWRIFKDTSATRRYINYDDGGTVYAAQIGRVPNLQTGTPYVLALSDQDGRVEMSNAGANQLTVPANATVAFPIGTEIRIVQVGAGATTIAGAVGVTVDAAGVVGGQWKSVMLYKRGTNEWVQTNV